MKIRPHRTAPPLVATLSFAAPRFATRSGAALSVVPLAFAALAWAMPGSGAALAADGRYRGASSIAGGTGDCWGNAPAEATVSGGTVTIRTTLYDGSSAPITGTVKAGALAATATLKNGGTVAITGKVGDKSLVANWKGPTCYGTFDMTK